MTTLPILAAILFASVLGVRPGLDWDQFAGRWSTLRYAFERLRHRGRPHDRLAVLEHMGLAPTFGLAPA